VTKLLERHKLTYSEKQIAAAVPRLGHKNADDALAAVGKGDLSGTDVLKALGIAVDEGDIKEARRRLAQKKPEKGGPLPFRCAAWRPARRSSSTPPPARCRASASSAL
jgi:(p)ppGpp synthase/HD superfamily hydrolase